MTADNTAAPVSAEEISMAYSLRAEVRDYIKSRGYKDITDIKLLKNSDDTYIMIFRYFDDDGIRKDGKISASHDKKGFAPV